MRERQEGEGGCMVDALKKLIPLCDAAAGIFGAEGGGEAQGRADEVEVLASFISSLYSVALLLLIPPSIHHLLVSKSCPCPFLGCVWLVASSLTKWLVLHEVSVCMMCWVSILFLLVLFFIFSCRFCFVFTAVHMTLVRDYGTSVLGQRFIWEAVTHMLLF